MVLQHPEVVKEVVNQQQNHTLLPRHYIFNVLLSFQLRQAIQIFEMMYYAQDYDTFYKVNYNTIYAIRLLCTNLIDKHDYTLSGFTKLHQLLSPDSYTHIQIK